MTLLEVEMTPLEVEVALLQVEMTLLDWVSPVIQLTDGRRGGYRRVGRGEELKRFELADHYTG